MATCRAPIIAVPKAVVEKDPETRRRGSVSVRILAAEVREIVLWKFQLQLLAELCHHHRVASRNHLKEAVKSLPLVAVFGNQTEAATPC